MTNSKQVLSSILKTSQMGQIRIRSILDNSMHPNIRCILEEQLSELSRIESQAFYLASQRGWELPEIQPGKRFLTDRRIRMKLGLGNRESRIADMMILENTRNIIEGIKLSNQCSKPDGQIGILSQKLMDCENANIRLLQQFL